MSLAERAGVAEIKTSFSASSALSASDFKKAPQRFTDERNASQQLIIKELIAGIQKKDIIKVQSLKNKVLFPFSAFSARAIN